MTGDELTVVEVTVPLSMMGSVWMFEGLSMDYREVVNFAVDARMGAGLCDWLEEFRNGERFDDEPPTVALESWQIRSRAPLS